MTVVVGCPPRDPAAGALRLGALLAKSSGEALLVVVVIPEPWVPGMARVDAEYQQFLDDQADEALEEARRALPPDLPASFLRIRASSAPRGLLKVAEQHDAGAIVLGSSGAGMLGRVALGSVTTHLLHGSPRLVALAPRGFRSRAERIGRISVAFGGRDAHDDLLLSAAREAARFGASLRLVSFAVRAPATISAGIGTRAESSVVAEWSRTIEQQAHETIGRISRLPQPPRVEPTEIGWGSDWDEAFDDIEWTDGDVLVVSSSSYGPVAQVFIGSRASKIIRHSHVPVVVVPRGRSATLSRSGDAQEAL